MTASIETTTAATEAPTTGTTPVVGAGEEFARLHPTTLDVGPNVRDHVGMLWAISLPPTREHETVHITGSSVDLVVGETVDFEWEQVPQDGYDYRAISVRPRRDGPTRTIRWEYGRDRHPGFVMRVVPRP